MSDVLNEPPEHDLWGVVDDPGDVCWGEGREGGSHVLRECVVPCVRHL